METVARYRQYAANCLRAAQQVSDPRTRSSLIDMAQVWKMLAEQTEDAAVLPQFLAKRADRP
jgi:hypothetical protein